MTTKNVKSTAKSLVAAALAAALAAGGAVAPALAAEATGPAPEAPVALVAQSVSSDYAIDEAVAATPLTYWDEVESVDWYYDASSDNYVVTVYSVYGNWWEVWVNATTGIAWQIA